MVQYGAKLMRPSSFRVAAIELFLDELERVVCRLEDLDNRCMIIDTKLGWVLMRARLLRTRLSQSTLMPPMSVKIAIDAELSSTFKMNHRNGSDRCSLGMACRMLEALLM